MPSFETGTVPSDPVGLVVGKRMSPVDRGEGLNGFFVVRNSINLIRIVTSVLMADGLMMMEMIDRWRYSCER